jgi:hypothetical protein
MLTLSIQEDILSILPGIEPGTITCAKSLLNCERKLCPEMAIGMVIA